MNSQTRTDLKWRIHVELRELHKAVDILNHRVADLLEIHRTDLRCMDILSLESPITAGRMSELSGLTSGAVTAVVDRLVAAGFVQRRPDPADRRRVLIEPTEKLSTIGEGIYGDLVMQTMQLLDEFSDRDLFAIFEFIHRGREITRAYAETVDLPEDRVD